MKRNEVVLVLLMIGGIIVAISLVMILVRMAS